MKAITMIKKIICALLLFSYINNNAAVLIDQSSTIEPTSDISWDFELKNKAPQNVRITVQNGSNPVLYKHLLNAATGNNDSDYSYLRLSDLNLKLPIIVTIVSEYGAVQAFAITPNNKTIYLSYDQRILIPQKGGGFLNRALSKTASGLSLKNNIDNKNITALSKKDSEQNLQAIILYKKWQHMTPSQLEREAHIIAKKQYSNDFRINTAYMKTIQSLIEQNSTIDPFSSDRMEE